MKGILLGCGLLALIVVLFVGVAVTVGYNRLVNLEEAVKSAWSQVENVYQRRADLVPNLVETVKGAAAFEKETFTAVTEARAKVGQVTLGKVPDAQEMQKFDTVGIDCVAMTVNDLICLGSEPVALLDYIALQKEDSELVEQLTHGLVTGAKEAGVAIVGGETAVVGDLLKGVGGHGFDLVSMGVGVVKNDSLIDGSAIREGDAVVGIASSGLHSNGYTLARRIVRGRSLDETVGELGETIGEALLRPTRIYVKPTLDAIGRREVHGIAHITGGAFTKLTRLVGKKRLQVRLKDIGQERAPPVFGFLQREGRLSDAEMYRTFNMGVGLCLVTPRSEVEAVLRDYRKRGFEGRQVGTVTRGEGVVVGTERIA